MEAHASMKSIATPAIVLRVTKDKTVKIETIASPILARMVEPVTTFSLDTFVTVLLDLVM